MMVKVSIKITQVVEGYIEADSVDRAAREALIMAAKGNLQMVAQMMEVYEYERV